MEANQEGNDRPWFLLIHLRFAGARLARRCCRRSRRLATRGAASDGVVPPESLPGLAFGALRTLPRALPPLIVPVRLYWPGDMPSSRVNTLLNAAVDS
jgi:hypothetical protein